MKPSGSFTRRDFLIRVIPSASAMLLMRPTPARGEPNPSAHFAHGIASGDPVQDRVIIWTRVSGITTNQAVQWEMAEDKDFTRIVRGGTATAAVAADYTVKVDVDGLAPGTTYYYRFTMDADSSPVGRTRTLPEGGVERLKIAIASCANYPAGYFNAYRSLAGHDDLDMVLHLGDYIYEYATRGYASERAERLGRTSVPEHELITLADYRLRYAQYRTDPDLQAVHARFPVIAMWDDHEIANDCWVGGAQNHDDGEGDWIIRRDAAIKAYYEWLPIRPPENRPLYANYRAFRFGDLADLFMLETRLSGRSKQLSYARDTPPREIAFDFTDENAPVAITDPAALEQLPPEKLRRIPVPFDMNQEPPAPMLDYQRIKSLEPENLPENYRFLPDFDRFLNEVLANPERQMLGSTQERWLADALQVSKTRGAPWQIIGNQTIVTHMLAANLAEGMTAEEKTSLSKRRRKFVEFTRLGLPFNLDAWNGYPAARERLYRMLSRHANKAVVVTGDTHNAWAIDLQSKDGSETYGLEIGTASISSPGAEGLGIAGERISRLVRDRNPQVRFMEGEHRGYVVLTFTREELTADYYFVNTVVERNFNVDQINPLAQTEGSDSKM